jgi:hypothetical protein
VRGNYFGCILEDSFGGFWGPLQVNGASPAAGAKALQGSCFACGLSLSGGIHKGSRNAPSGNGVSTTQYFYGNAPLRRCFAYNRPVQLSAKIIARCSYCKNLVTRTHFREKVECATCKLTRKKLYKRKLQLKKNLVAFSRGRGGPHGLR